MTSRKNLVAKRLEVTRFDLDKIKWGSFHGYMLYDQSRALKVNDIWIVDQISLTEIKVRNRISSHVFTIPLSSLIRGLRRQSYVKTIDVTNKSDYLIAKPFSSLHDIIEDTPESIRAWSDDTLLEWQKIFHSRKSKLIISRRFDISAKGTCCLSYFSEADLVAAGTMWHIKGVDDEYTLHNTQEGRDKDNEKYKIRLGCYYCSWLPIVVIIYIYI